MQRYLSCCKRDASAGERGELTATSSVRVCPLRAVRHGLMLCLTDVWQCRYKDQNVDARGTKAIPSVKLYSLEDPTPLDRLLSCLVNADP